MKNDKFEDFLIFGSVMFLGASFAYCFLKDKSFRKALLDVIKETLERKKN